MQSLFEYVVMVYQFPLTKLRHRHISSIQLVSNIS